MVENDGKNLIFIASQPRSGSTLLQKIIGSHPDVHTVSEPWLMLYPLYGQAYSHNITAGYNVTKSLPALKEFNKCLPKKGHEFYEGLRLMYSHIYNSALSASKKKYFLDKTPRYYYIVNELIKVFPQAKFIILHRNPVFIMLSILNTWTRSRQLYAYDIHDDLLLAPGLLARKNIESENSVLRVHYEGLVSDPENVVKKITDFIGLDYNDSILNYNNNISSRWAYGDQSNVYQHSRPTAINKPLSQLSLPLQHWRFCSDYLNYLGPELVFRLGYSYEELRNQLNNIQPPRHQLLLTTSLSSALKKPWFIPAKYMKGTKALAKKVLSVAKANL